MTQHADLRSYREHPREVERVSRLLKLVPEHGALALDVGARDGHLSMLLTQRFERVVALDLERPAVEHSRIECVQGDAAALPYPDNSFETVVCAEVLEHIPQRLLSKVCNEIVRVTSHCAVIGVPYLQDLRVACTTCRRCGTTNPPWGHVNSFDEPRLAALMKGLSPTAVDFVGRTRAATNGLSAGLLAFAGNPYGTYDQEEVCVNCQQALLPPLQRSLAQKAATKLAVWGMGVQSAFTPWRGNWVHMRFDKLTAPCPPVAHAGARWQNPSLA